MTDRTAALITEARGLLAATGAECDEPLRSIIARRAAELVQDSGTMQATVAALRLRDIAASEARERLAAQRDMHRPRPLDEWHEDLGVVLWHRFPIEEAPYCGTPNDSDWSGYHTHWTPLPSCNWIMEEAMSLGIPGAVDG